MAVSFGEKRDVSTSRNFYPGPFQSFSRIDKVEECDARADEKNYKSWIHNK